MHRLSTAQEHHLEGRVIPLVRLRDHSDFPVTTVEHLIPTESMKTLSQQMEIKRLGKWSFFIVHQSAPLGDRAAVCISQLINHFSSASESLLACVALATTLLDESALVAVAKDGGLEGLSRRSDLSRFWRLDVPHPAGPGCQRAPLWVPDGHLLTMSWWGLSQLCAGGSQRPLVPPSRPLQTLAPSRRPHCRDMGLRGCCRSESHSQGGSRWGSHGPPVTT